VHYTEVSNDKKKSKHVSLAQQNGFGPTFLYTKLKWRKCYRSTFSSSTNHLGNATQPRDKPKKSFIFNIVRQAAQNNIIISKVYTLDNSRERPKSHNK